MKIDRYPVQFHFFLNIYVNCESIRSVLFDVQLLIHFFNLVRTEISLTKVVWCMRMNF